MNILKNKILLEVKIEGNGILKVDTFLNHQVDIPLINKIAKKFYNYYKNNKITKILTIEASGIAIAAFVAKNFKVPLIFAKKSFGKNINNKYYTSIVKSYTKNITYTIYVSKNFILKNDKVLLIDDFLANGSALLGLSNIVKSSGANIVGAGIVIEKTFLPGFKYVKKEGINVYSLIKIASIKNNNIIFK